MTIKFIKIYQMYELIFSFRLQALIISLIFYPDQLMADKSLKVIEKIAISIRIFSCTFMDQF